jgi:acetyl esterase/lipase
MKTPVNPFKLCFLISLSFLICQNAFSQEKKIPLYDGPAPGSESWNWDEDVYDSPIWQTRVVYNVTKPSLTLFSPNPALKNGTAIIVCPGGGFYGLSINSEGYWVAKYLADKGITVFVLEYRLSHSLTKDPVKENMTISSNQHSAVRANTIPFAVADGRAAIAYVRNHAAEYGVKPNQIGIIGFSAGGTVAASTAYNYSPENKPDFAAPVYAFMPPELQGTIASDAPPLFLVAATNDQLGLATHSVDIYSKWLASKHSAELHMYAQGGHGFGLKHQNLPTDTWIDRFADWLGLLGYLKPLK